MKQFLLTGITLLFCISTHAQDTIIKRNGNIQLAKILEISATEVKYKKFDFLDGPNFIENKSNIQLIKYSNGSREEFEAQAPINTSIQKESNADYYSGPVNPPGKIESHGTRFRYQGNRINERELHRILLNSNDDQITLLVNRAKKARGLQWIGLGGIAVGAVGGISFLLGEAVDEPNLQLFGAICSGVAIAFPVSTFIFKHRRNVSNENAIKAFNAKF